MAIISHQKRPGKTIKIREKVILKITLSCNPVSLIRFYSVWCDTYISQ